MKVYNEYFRPFDDQCLYFGGSKSESETETVTNTTSTVTTTTNQADNRKGVSDQGILLESDAVLDQSVTIEDANAEIIATSLQPVAGVLESTDNLVNRNAEIVENVLDTQENIFGQSVGLVSETQNQSQDLIQKVAGQNNALATKFLQESKDLVQDANTGTGEKLGQTALIVVAVAAVAFVAFNRK